MRKALRITGWTLLGLLAAIILFVVTMLVITRGDYQVPLTVQHDSSIAHVEIDGVVFHAETFGNDTSQVVIVLHGGPGNDYRYLLPLKKLSDYYRVVFYDQRGTGLSPRVGEEEHSMENSIEDLASIIEHYSPEQKVYLIGHSWGAMIASGYLAQHPERVGRVILAEPGMLTSEKAREYVEKFRVKTNWPMVKAMTRIYFESLHVKGPDDQARMDYIFGQIPTLDLEGNPMLKYFCNEDLSTARLDFWRLSGVASRSIMEKGIDSEGNIHIDLVSGVENYTDKVLFVVGECNQIIGKEFQEGHMQHFTNAEMKVIKGAGHTMFGEKTEASLKIIRDYFTEEISD